jgi:hypothetical protein
MNTTKTLIAAAIVALAGVAAIPPVAAIGDPDACTERWVTGEKDEGQIVQPANGEPDSVEGELNEFVIDHDAPELVTDLGEASTKYAQCIAG